MPRASRRAAPLGSRRPRRGRPRAAVRTRRRGSPRRHASTARGSPAAAPAAGDTTPRRSASSPAAAAAFAAALAWSGRRPSCRRRPLAASPPQVPPAREAGRQLAGRTTLAAAEEPALVRAARRRTRFPWRCLARRWALCWSRTVRRGPPSFRCGSRGCGRRCRRGATWRRRSRTSCLVDRFAARSPGFPCRPYAGRWGGRPGAS
mmetsp:Transcript_25216/g.81543  ORF Transcript_25216/g.81543 Transcript_25216/m.81543 type:complete len:205 (-) Transcript_25216:702-1316(-)